MYIGGCLYVDDYDICMPTNLEDAFDRAAAEQIIEDKKKEEDNECCICYETIGEKNNCITDCGHRFCFGCMLKAMTYNTSCPCCRKELLEEEEETENDTEINESDTDESGLDINEEDIGDIEDIAERMEKEGITMLDVVSVLFNSYSKKDAKYTDAYIAQLNTRMDQIADDVENEAKENSNMAKEDRAGNA
jgi:hypothetical protein